MALDGFAGVIEQVAEGVLGVVPTIRIGDVVVSSLVGLSSPETTFVTRKPVQAGYNITDAGTDDSRTKQLTVVLIDPEYSAEAGLNAALSGDLSGLTETWRDKKAQIRQYRLDHELVEVQDHEELIESMMIENIDPIYDNEQNDDGWIATISLVQVTQVGAGGDDGLLDSALEDVGIL